LRKNQKIDQPISVGDIFAGPGGLGEGFSAFKVADSHPFKVRLSIEMNPIAHQTLLLRAFYRQFSESEVPDDYYDFLQNTNELQEGRLKALFDKHPAEATQAEQEARQAELGIEKRKNIRQWLDNSLGDAQHWVLIGGPPCQAYSLAGRSRNKGIDDYIAEDDERQYLYVEYLQIIADHMPAVFVMENVKGLLSATLNDQKVFERICDDLQEPIKALKREGRSMRKVPKAKRDLSTRYKLFSLVNYGEDTPNYSLFSTTDTTQDNDLSRFIVRMEKHKIPQARHRLIILGIREDLSDVEPRTLKISSPVQAKQVLSGLPRLRSGLSREQDSSNAWIKRLREMSDSCLFQAAGIKAGKDVVKHLTTALESIEQEDLNRGSEFISCVPTIEHEDEWFLDERLGGVCNHSTRGHIVKDLYRYFYAACYAEVFSRSPNLKHFPEVLLPEHANVKAALEGNNFSDRFRVQLADQPSTTVTSHISKDGHYYIHYDPTQCRSLTVREAARIQTFPDNYFFCGSRTAQYTQVGNAVPPLLANQIAEIVFDVLKQKGIVK
jgi:DNA (cytosine-5)-methyltransferase 1